LQDNQLFLAQWPDHVHLRDPLSLLVVFRCNILRHVSCEERNICGIRLIISDDGPNTRNLGHWT
jgi:hypothetical protein